MASNIQAHHNWQGKLLSDINYVVTKAKRKFSLTATLEEAQTVLATCKKYEHAEIWEKTSVAGFDLGLVLVRLGDISVIGNSEHCFDNLSNTHPLEHKNIFKKVQ